MQRCKDCGTLNDGGHTCTTKWLLCHDCNGHFPESEINGHRCKAFGVKHDQNKPDLSLLPKEFLEEVAKAFMHGEKKYARYNYLAGMDWHRVIASAFRHLSAFNEGEDLDTESGNNHLAHAGACIAMLLVYYKRGIGKDTRYKRST